MPPDTGETRRPTDGPHGLPPAIGEPGDGSARDPAGRPPVRTPACPVCGGRLDDIRGKLVCRVCHTICETCCEGGPPE